MNHQDSETIIITFLLLLPGLGVPQYRLSRYGESTSKRKAGKQNKTSEAKFRRNPAMAFTHYLSERPEMSSQ